MTKTGKQLRGIVQQNPVALEQCCIFAVEQGKDLYLVLSTEEQAGKDNIFVERGQEILIRGSMIEEQNFKGVILTERAKIALSREADK